MTLVAFGLLNKEQQINVIKQEGIFLYVRNEAGVDIILYQVGSFYAEVFFEAEGAEKVLIKSFEDTELLHTYLQKINISELKQLL
jgi:hypothetical protein